MNDDSELEFSRWVHVLRRRWRFVTVVVLGFVVLGLTFGVVRGPSYTARTSVLLPDPLSDQLVDPSAVGGLPVLAQLARNDAVLSRAKLSAHGASTLSARVTPDGHLVQFTATAPSGVAAARAANDFARGFLTVSSAAINRQLAAAIGALQDTIDHLDARLSDRRLSADDRTSLQARRAAYAAALNRALLRRDLAADGQANVLTPATAPTSPDGGSLFAYVLVSLVAGGVLAVVAAGVRDARDDRVHSVQDLVSAASDPGSIKATQVVPLPSDLPLRRRAKGRRRPVEDLPRFGEGAADAYAILRSSLSLGVNPEHLVVIVAEADEGPGAMEVAADLAEAFARAGRRTLFAPLDIRHPLPASVLAALGDTSGLSGKRSGSSAKGVDSSLNLRVSPVLAIPGLLTLTSKPLVDPQDFHDTLRLGALVSGLAGLADVVVATAPPVTTSPDAVLLAAHAQHTLVVVRKDRTHAAIVRRAVQRLEGSGCSTSLVLLECADRTTPLAWVQASSQVEVPSPVSPAGAGPLEAPKPALLAEYEEPEDLVDLDVTSRRHTG